MNNITTEREENIPCPQGDQNSTTQGNSSPETVYQDRREDQRKPEEEGGREGQGKPEEEGGRESQGKQEEEDGREGQGNPEEESGSESQRKPEEEGGRESQRKPEEEGGREDQGKPEEEGGKESQGKPEEEDGRENQGKPAEEGGREVQGKPEEEGGREGQRKPGSADGCSNDVLVGRDQGTLSGEEREGEETCEESVPVKKDTETSPEYQTINATNKYQTGKEYCIIMVCLRDLRFQFQKISYSKYWYC